MSTQELDVRRSWRAVWRNRRIVAAAIVAGAIAGVVFGVLNPPLYTATARVILPAPPPSSADRAEEGSHSIETQVLVARSEPVLSSAGQNLDPPLTTEETRDLVQVRPATTDVLEIQASGSTAKRAVTLTNAVTQIYLVYAADDANPDAAKRARTDIRVLERAVTAQRGNLVLHYVMYAGLGGVAAAVVSAVAILAATRGDRRLRWRGEIANSVGIPVMASVSSERPRNVADWQALLDGYQPSSVDAWGLQQALRHADVDPVDGQDSAGGLTSIAVVTFADDDKALALGPQLATYANTSGVDTALAVETPVEATEALLAADPAVAAAPVAEFDAGDPANALRVSLVVVDRERPQLAGTSRTALTVIGLSAGVVTAEELARLVLAAAADGRTIDGIIVADPDPSDRTSGRVPQLARGSRSAQLAASTSSVRRAGR